MSTGSNIKLAQRRRRRKHIRKNIYGTAERPRLVVFRSNKHIYGQLVDDVDSKTITSTSSLSKDLKAGVGKAENKIETAKLVGKHLADLAKNKKIERVVFDRAGYLYHGRIKALADGAREGGLDF
ncbi:50S ribosomal protein L18 [candidate division KSB1 bacterium]|nr:50S ribosomal protein L18 [candidate division KSB1 bacterium]